MKKIIIPVFVYMVFSSTLLFAQNSLQGIYLSRKDCSNNHISFSPTKEKKYKLKLYQFSNKPTIKITIGDSMYTLNKDSIFGYRDNKNIVYRFYQKNLYTILNPTENILLYSRTFLGGYKNAPSVIQYFFSTPTNEAIQPLTKWQLKKIFLHNTAFYQLLDMAFINDSDLLKYDSFYKMYKLNQVFQYAQQLTTTLK
jgi:hypothetical protein